MGYEMILGLDMTCIAVSRIEIDINLCWLVYTLSDSTWVAEGKAMNVHKTWVLLIRFRLL